MAFLIRWATKLAVVGGATVLVINHEVFGANKYTQQITNKIRTALPDTAEAFDKIPSRQEVNHSVGDTWNSGVQSTFKWLVDASMHTRRLFSSLSDKIKS